MYENININVVLYCVNSAIVNTLAEAKKSLGFGSHAYMSYLDLKKSSMFGAATNCYHNYPTTQLANVPFMPYGYHQGMMNFAMAAPFGMSRRNDDSVRLTSSDVRGISQQLVLTSPRYTTSFRDLFLLNIKAIIIFI